MVRFIGYHNDLNDASSLVSFLPEMMDDEHKYTEGLTFPFLPNDGDGVVRQYCYLVTSCLPFQLFITNYGILKRLFYLVIKKYFL